MPNLWLPEPTLGWTVARRAAVAWPLVRLVTAAGAAALDPAAGSDPLAVVRLSPRAALFAALAATLVAAALPLLETRRRNEHRLLANLGTGPAGLVGLALAPGVLGELLLFLLLRA